MCFCIDFGAKLISQIELERLCQKCVSTCTTRMCGPGKRQWWQLELSWML